MTTKIEASHSVNLTINLSKAATGSMHFPCEVLNKHFLLPSSCLSFSNPSSLLPKKGRKINLYKMSNFSRNLTTGPEIQSSKN